MEMSLARQFRLYGLVAVVGVIAGILAGSFHRFLEFVEGRRELFQVFHDLTPLPGWLIAPLCCAVAAAGAVWLVRRFAPSAAGSGIQEIEGTLQGVRSLPWRRLLPVKFIAGAWAIAGGLVLGREGPLIHMGGTTGQMISELTKLDDHSRRILIASGAGAGLAAAFNAPLAGILFVTEEMRNEFRYTFISFQSVVLCCCVATAVNDVWLGQGPSLPIQTFPAPALDHLPLFALLGALVGAYGVFFNWGLMRALSVFQRLTHGHQVRGALAFGAMIGLLVWFAPAAIGGGEGLIHRLLEENFSLWGILALLVIRTATSVGSYSLGTPGGIFAPMLALGTLAGLLFGKAVDAAPFLHVDYPGTFAVAAMGALFASTVRAPVTGVILVLELTGNFEMVLAIIVTCLSATFVAEALGGRPIYRLLLERVLRQQQVRETTVSPSKSAGSEP